MPDDLSKCTIHLVGHAHIDLGYRWRWNETVHRIARDTFRGVLRMMEQEPELIFVQSQLALYEAMQREYPDIFSAIKRRVAEGRWIVVDGWCEYDHMMTSGEAMIRQHLIGARYARQHLDCDVTMAWAPDCFSGHTQTLPTILKGCGITSMLYGRGVLNNTPFFWWKGPDGASVLAYSPVFSYSAVIGPQLLDGMKQWQQMTGANEALVLYGRGDHGGGPRDEDLTALHNLRAQPGAPRLVHTAPERFFSEVLQPRRDLTSYQGDLGGGSTGSYTSEGRSKQRARQVETLLLTAERFAAIATSFQRKPVYPRVDFSDAWKRVLHHNFHDELPGTSRAPVFEDNAADFDLVEKQMSSVLETALAEIGNRIDTRGAGEPVLVFNPLAWQRSEPVQRTLRLSRKPQHITVRDSNGVAVPTQIVSVVQQGHFWLADVLFVAASVPPMGYKLLRAFVDDTPNGNSPLQVRGMSLENEFFQLRISPQSGNIASIIDKQTQHDVLAGPGNVLQAIAEKPGETSAWLIALTDQVENLTAPDSVEVIERGPVRAIVRSSYRYRDSYFTQDVILHAGLARVDVRFQADWHERECCLKTSFPLRTHGGQATFEAPYGHVVRPANGAEAGAQNWIDLSSSKNGASLLNNARYGFDVNDNVMRMTLLRGIPDLDPRADEGAHDLSYAFYPHSGDWRAAQTVRRGLEFNFPLLARQEMRHSGMMDHWITPAAYEAIAPEFSFVQLEPANVVLTALKVEEEEWGEWSPLVLRMYETVGNETDATLTLPSALRFCEETNHLEQRRAGADVSYEGKIVRVHMRPYEIKTIRLAFVTSSLGLPDARQEEEGRTFGA